MNIPAIYAGMIQLKGALINWTSRSGTDLVLKKLQMTLEICASREAQYQTVQLLESWTVKRNWYEVMKRRKLLGTFPEKHKHISYWKKISNFLEKMLAINLNIRFILETKFFFPLKCLSIFVICFVFSSLCSVNCIR